MEFRRTVVITAPLNKFGGEVALKFLSHTSCDVLVLTPHLKDIETLRSQLCSSWRERLISVECEFHTRAAIKMGILRLKETLDRIDAVIHLKPFAETGTPQQLKQLISANDYAVKLFTSELPKHYPLGIDFLILEHSVSESTQFVADCAFKETMDENN